MEQYEKQNTDQVMNKAKRKAIEDYFIAYFQNILLFCSLKLN